MAEAVATLALASSILQVIDFSARVASTASKIYQASKRNDESLDELEAAYKILSSTLDTIRKSNASTEDSGVDNGIKSLAESCSERATKLLDTMYDHGVGKAKTKRQAVWIALQRHWKDEEILSLRTELDDFRSQLTVCLLVSVRQCAVQSLSRQGEILEKLGKIGDKPIGASVLEYVTSELDATSRKQQRRFLENDLIEAIKEDKAIPSDDINSPRIITNGKVKQKSIDLLLQSLEYPGMQDREERIVDPHESTFKWIFEKGSNKWVSFKDWLESDGKLYWITGKAGSGKSTMMRYISHPSRLAGQRLPKSRSHKYLERWAGRDKLIIASFYFWNSGVETQTTQEGLLKTLLRQIFKQCPDLLPLASPSRWENLSSFGLNPDWKVTELRSLLFSCIENLEKLRARIALFIDGLDEFGGDLQDLISMFEQIQKLPHHKLCVSSRPWNQFRDAFARNPSLMVEHLTRDDIKHFISSRFDKHPVFVQLRMREKASADQLVEDIVEKASGVFLWVSLVVSSLLTGMSDGDGIADFHQELNLIPQDLSDLYRKMIQDIKPSYLEHTAQLFALVRANREPMNLLLASYVDEENPKIALEMDCTLITDQDAQVRMEAMRRRINSRSKGLLEVKGGTSTPQGFVYDSATHTRVTVQYLHRTVKDFIETDSEAQQIFAGALEPSFDSHVMSLAGHLAYMKRNRAHFTNEGQFGEYLLNCFFNARAVQARSVNTMNLILDNLETLCPPTVVIPGLVTQGRYSSHYSFLSLATTCNVVEYIRAKCTKVGIRHATEYTSPLLMEAVSGELKNDSLSVTALENPTTSTKERYRATIEVVLKNGADPKYKIDNSRMVMRQTSPLIMAVIQYINTQNDLFLVALELLAKKTRFDSTTIACIIFECAKQRKYKLGRGKRLDVGYYYWYLMKRDVRKALIDAARGKPPDFETFWDEMFEQRLERLTTESDKSHLRSVQRGPESMLFYNSPEFDIFEDGPLRLAE